MNNFDRKKKKKKTISIGTEEETKPVEIVSENLLESPVRGILKVRVILELNT